MHPKSALVLAKVVQWMYRDYDPPPLSVNFQEDDRSHVGLCFALNMDGNRAHMRPRLRLLAFHPCTLRQNLPKKLLQLRESLTEYGRSQE